MNSFNILSRRRFLDLGMKAGMAAAFSSLVDIPLVAKRALAADNTLGRNGKKLLFIFLRGANDALNSVIPIQDSAYYTSRPVSTSTAPGIGIPKDAIDYTKTGPCDLPPGDPNGPVYNYPYGIRLGNGFSALHPSLKFLAPLYNSGELALIHRVGYPKQSRSHFDSQNYWETGNPNNNLSKDGIFYRTIIESELARTAALTAVSIQSSLPLILRGSQAAMTNLNDPRRYNLLGVPNSSAGNLKADNALRAANEFTFAHKRNRDLLALQYQNMMDTLSIFASINFSESGNIFRDDQNTDGDTQPYYLFPTANEKNGGYAFHGNNAQKYVVRTGAYDFFENLKAAALVLNKTDAIIAGTQLDGFDTHSNQGGVTGSHSELLKTVGWSFYALKKYFSNPQYADKVNWNNLVIVTLSEFGRTTVQNSDIGTDHAEAGVMFVAGGGVKGYGKGNPSGVFGGSPSDPIPWVTGPSGSMFGASQRYLKRAIDYRSVLGKIIRDHLGASQDQLKRIIPGYAVPGESLLTRGISTRDATQILGEPSIL